LFPYHFQFNLDNHPLIQTDSVYIMFEDEEFCPLGYTSMLSGESHLVLSSSWWFFASPTLQPWRWRRYVLPRRLLTFNGLHCVMSQKVKLFTSTAVRISNPTSMTMRHALEQPTLQKKSPHVLNEIYRRSLLGSITYLYLQMVLMLIWRTLKDGVYPQNHLILFLSLS
jgi:hypothetical protein